MSLFTVCNLDGPRIRHRSHGGTFKRNTERAAERRKALPGYPIPAGPFTAEQIVTYLSGDRIVCLLCGKSYRKISGPHLSKIHGVGVDEYRERYGLPYGTGVLSAASSAAHTRAALSIGHDETWMATIRPLRTSTHSRSGISRVSVVKRQTAVKNLKDANLIPEGPPLGPQDVRSVLAEMVTRDRIFSEVIRDRGRSYSRFHELVGQSPDLQAELETTHEQLSFAAQARAQRLGARFAQAVRALRPLADRHIAAKLGVSTMTVNTQRKKWGIP